MSMENLIFSDGLVISLSRSLSRIFPIPSSRRQCQAHKAFTMWSSYQRQRLATEKTVLSEHFPDAVWHNPTTRGQTKVDLPVRANNGAYYQLRIYVPEDFPNSCPEMVLLRSYRGYKLRDGSPLPTGSYTHHTIGKRDGYIRLCHYYPSSWDSRNTLYLVFMKGRIWIEAFECHHRTGKPLDHYLKEMPH